MSGVRSLAVVAAITLAQHAFCGAVFDPAIQIGSNSCWGIVKGDFNKDSNLDVIIASNASGIYLYTGKGDGTFNSPATINTAQYRSVATADLNGDGSLDLVLTSQGGTVSVLSGNGDGSFGAPVSHMEVIDLYYSTIIDVNKDAKLDVVTAVLSGSVAVRLGNGDGTLAATSVSYTAGTNCYSAQGADLNGDGFVDLVVGTATASISVLLNRGDGTFNQAVPYTPYCKDLALADFNHDSKLDIVGAAQGSNALAVFSGNGDGTFANSQFFTPAPGARGVAVADFDLNGELDVIVSNAASGSGVSLFNGNGSLAFIHEGSYPFGTAPHAVVAGDFNKDSKPDIVICDSQAGLFVMLNKYPGGNSLVADPQDLTVSSGLPYDLTLTGTATPDRPFTFSLGASPTNGAITNFNSLTGAVTYTSNNGYFGPDSFSFTITDGTVNSPPADITLTVSPATTVSADDAAATYTGAAQSIPVTAHVNSAGGSVNEGTVTFQLKDGANNVGTAVTSPVANGTATGSYALAANLIPNVYAISVVYSGGPNFGGSSDSNAHLTFSKAVQTLDFTAPSNMGVNDPAQTLVATATSGLPVSFVVDSGPATVNGTSITADGRGTVVVRATQAGDSYYSAAPDISQTFDIGGSPQFITFSTISNKTFGDPAFTLDATSDSGLPITFTKTGPVTINGDQVTITGAGSVTITASQIGDSEYEPADDVLQTFTVAKASQTITFSQIADRRFGDPPLTLSATATSNLSVSFVVLQGPAMVSGNTLTITDAGLIAIQAVQAGNANYAAATTVQRIFTVAPNLPPTSTSPATATPSQGLANTVIAFSGQGSDAEGDTLTYTWDFGDGTNATGPSVNHAYATVGTYNVTLTITDGRSGSATSTVTVFIMDRLTITKMAVKLIFNKAGGDSISVTGTLPLPPTFVFGGNPVDVNIGGIARSFTLDTKGKSAKAVDSIAVAKPKAGLAKYTIKFTKGSFAESLADEGLTNGNKSAASTPIIVSIRINSKGYLKVQPQLYTAKMGKSGATK